MSTFGLSAYQPRTTPRPSAEPRPQMATGTHDPIDLWDGVVGALASERRNLYVADHPVVVRWRRCDPANDPQRSRLRLTHDLAADMSDSELEKHLSELQRLYPSPVSVHYFYRWSAPKETGDWWQAKGSLSAASLFAVGCLINERASEGVRRKMVACMPVSVAIELMRFDANYDIFKGCPENFAIDLVRFGIFKRYPEVVRAVIAASPEMLPPGNVPEPTLRRLASSAALVFLRDDVLSAESAGLPYEIRKAVAAFWLRRFHFGEAQGQGPVSPAYLGVVAGTTLLAALIACLNAPQLHGATVYRAALAGMVDELQDYEHVDFLRTMLTDFSSRLETVYHRGVDHGLLSIDDVDSHRFRAVRGPQFFDDAQRFTSNWIEQRMFERSTRAAQRTGANPRETAHFFALAWMMAVLRRPGLSLQARQAGLS